MIIIIIITPLTQASQNVRREALVRQVQTEGYTSSIREDKGMLFREADTLKVPRIYRQWDVQLIAQVVTVLHLQLPTVTLYLKWPVADPTPAGSRFSCKRANPSHADGLHPVSAGCVCQVECVGEAWFGEGRVHCAWGGAGACLVFKNVFRPNATCPNKEWTYWLPAHCDQHTVFT